MTSTVPQQSASQVSTEALSSDGGVRPRPARTPRLSAERASGPSRESLARLHSEAESLVQSFAVGSGKGRVDLGRTNLIRGLVQTFKRGSGERSLHYHSNTDSLWMVLKGRVRFHGANDEAIGDFGPQEGAIMPAYARYWFENAGDGDLEMLQVMAFHDRDRKDAGRTDL